MCDSSPFPEICDRILRPLVGLGEKHATGEFRLRYAPAISSGIHAFRGDFRSWCLRVRRGKECVEPQTVHAHAQPKIEHLLHRLVHCRIVEIQIRLMRIKAVPVIRFRDRIPRPVRSLEIFEDDARVLVFFRRIAPDVESRAPANPAVRGATFGTTGFDRRYD